MSDHARFSPSAAHRWLMCPASVKLSKDAPPQPVSRYAVEGTKAHSEVERALKFFLKHGSLPKPTGQSVVDEAVKHYAEIAKGGHETHLEQRLKHPKFGDTLWGTADFIWVSPFAMIVSDFKSGAGVSVYPREGVKLNPQLAYYAMAAAEKFGIRAQNIIVEIVQPLAGGVKRTITLYDEVKGWEEEFSKAIENALSPSPRFAPYTGEHCRWCPAINICPKQNAGLAVAETSIPSVIPELPEEIGEVLHRLTILDDFKRALYAKALQLAEQGFDIPHFKLVAKRGSRRWTEDATVIAEMLFGEEAFDKSLKSPAQLEKIGPEAKSFVREHTAMVSSGSTLVPVQSNRRELKTTLLSNFED